MPLHSGGSGGGSVVVVSGGFVAGGEVAGGAVTVGAGVGAGVDGRVDGVAGVAVTGAGEPGDAATACVFGWIGAAPPEAVVAVVAVRPTPGVVPVAAVEVIVPSAAITVPAASAGRVGSTAAESPPAVVETMT